ncbi:hypothetical protein HK104_011404 [Borealophlyctis nickersoniae]|nr:hypothetical protein HK104_011404 [Borealophlyctis nickersoniae]
MPLAFNISRTHLTLSFTGTQKLLTGRLNDLSIPLDRISSVVVDPPELEKPIVGMRFGTAFPGWIMAGTNYHLKEKKDFIYVQNKSRAIGIYLLPDDTLAYAKLLLEVPEDTTPEKVVKDIERAMDMARSAGPGSSAGAADAPPPYKA